MTEAAVRHQPELDAPSREKLEPEKLDTVMNLFWERGYANVTMQEIVAATGMNRYAIYRTWGSKHGLFLDALEQYKRRFIDTLYAPFHRDEAGLEAVREVFDHVMQLVGTEAGRRGCMMLSTLSDEAARHDPEFTARMDEYLRAHRALFERVMENARRQGQVSADADVQAYTDYLLGIMQGAHVFGRARADATTLRRFLDTAYTALR